MFGSLGLRIGAVALTLVAAGNLRSAYALKFEIRQDGAKHALYVRDCEEQREPCEEYEKHFVAGHRGASYPGDEVMFRAALRNGHIDEVWVASGGGAVAAAVPMAQLLRASGLPIYVPKGQRCVSSCTIFFMGGTLRFIEPGATYEVHSASSWQDGAEGDKYEVIKSIARYPDKELPDFVREEQQDQREMALTLLRLFQNTLLLPTGKSTQSEDPDQIRQEAAKGEVPRFDPLHEAAYQHDLRRIRAEGRAAVQDILMRIEREQMAAAITWLAQRHDLGPRAEPAIEMVRTMYMESIRETSTLSQSELERRGYVTPVLPD